MHLLNQIRIGKNEYDTFQLAFWIVFAFQQFEPLRENRKVNDRERMHTKKGIIKPT